MRSEEGRPIIRQGHFGGVLGIFLMGCAVLLAVGCAAVRLETPGEEEKGRTAATEEQARSPEATASEEDRCEGTRTVVRQGGAGYATNDVPGCPKGGLLLGTDGASYLYGGEGEDEIRGLGSPGRQFDELWGGDGSDTLYGGAGADFLYGQQGDDVLYGGDGGEILVDGGKGEDVIHGGDGNDYLVEASDGRRDKLYCGKGRDHYSAEDIDYVDSSCEEGELVDTSGPPLILLACAMLLLGSGLVIGRQVIRRAF